MLRAAWTHVNARCLGSARVSRAGERGLAIANFAQNSSRIRSGIKLRRKRKTTPSVVDIPDPMPPGYFPAASTAPARTRAKRFLAGSARTRASLAC
jgi:hypothetical protein